MIDQAMWLTAGLGTRMRPFTSIRPKPFLPLWGVPLAHWTLASLKDAGIRTVICNRHWLPDVFDRYLLQAQAAYPTLDIQVSDEAHELLGSAGGIRNALDHFGDEPFLWINGDTWGDFDLRRLQSAHARNRAAFPQCLMTLGLRKISGGANYRTFLCESDGKLSAASSGSYFFAGVAVMEPSAFEGLPQSVVCDLYPAVLAKAMEQGQVFGECLENPFFFDLGSPADWIQAHDTIAHLKLAPPVGRQDRPLIEVADNVWAQCPEEIVPILQELSFAPRSYIYWDAAFALPPAGKRLYFGGHWA